MFRRNLLAIAVSMAAVFPAVAQETDKKIEVIIVTAEKVEKSILDVSTTTNVLDEAFLARENLTEMNQVSNFIPNMLVQEQSVGGQSFTIRGIGNEDGEQKLGSFFNGLNVTDRIFSGQFLHDIERVEVLKGPQPTAFGSFAVNGAVNIVSKKPDFTGNSFKVGAGVGSFSETRLEGMANVVATDWLAFRLAGFSVDKEGYSKNLSGEAQNARVGTNIRFTSAVDTERFDADLIIAYEKNDGPGIGFKSKYYIPEGGDGSAFTPLDFGDTKTTLQREVTIYQLKTALDITDSISVNYNGYYNDGELYEYFDAEGGYARIDERDYHYNATFTGHELFANYSNDWIDARIGYNDLEAKSQYPDYTLYTDFQWYTARAVAESLVVAPTGYPDLSDDRIYPDGFPLQALRAEAANTTLALGPLAVNPVTGAPIPGGITTLVPFSFPEAVNDTSGYFVSVDLRLIENLTVSLGMRDEETEFNGNPDDSAEPLYKLGLNYSVSDQLSVYYTYSEGRTPPLNTIVISDVERETVDSNDIGFYYVSGDLTLQGAYFTFDYDNLIVSVTDSETGLGTTANADQTNVSGFELQGEYQITNNFSVFGSYGSNDAVYGSTTDAGFVSDYSGNNFRYSPEYSYAAGVRFNDERWNATLSWTYMDDVYFEPSNDPDTLQAGYGLLNGSVEYRVSDALTVAVYGKNILDEDYLIDAGNFGGSRGYPTLIEGTPANFQAVVRYSF